MRSRPRRPPPTLPAGNLMILYEAENHCPGGVNQQPFYATIGFARSSDNGKTWPAPATGPLGNAARHPVLKSNELEPSTPHTAMGDAIPSGFPDSLLTPSTGPITRPRCSTPTGTTWRSNGQRCLLQRQARRRHRAIRNGARFRTGRRAPGSARNQRCDRDGGRSQRPGSIRGSGANAVEFQINFTVPQQFHPRQSCSRLRIEQPSASPFPNSSMPC